MLHGQHRYIVCYWDGGDSLWLPTVSTNDETAARAMCNPWGNLWTIDTED